MDNVFYFNLNEALAGMLTMFFNWLFIGFFMGLVRFMVFGIVERKD